MVHLQERLGDWLTLGRQPTNVEDYGTGPGHFMGTSWRKFSIVGKLRKSLGVGQIYGNDTSPKSHINIPCLFNKCLQNNSQTVLNVQESRILLKEFPRDEGGEVKDCGKLGHV